MRWVRLVGEQEEQQMHFASLRFALFALLAAATAGCELSAEPAPSHEVSPHLSLTDIGEHSVATAESLEEDGLTAGALEAYRRALWAFEYHQTLTGRPPLLLEEARAGVARLERKKSSQTSPYDPE